MDFITKINNMMLLYINTTVNTLLVENPPAFDLVFYIGIRVRPQIIEIYEI